MTKPLIVVDPQPRGLTESSTTALLRRLRVAGDLAVHDGPGRMPAERFEALLPEMALLIGQSDMPKDRLDRAKKLRGIVNVETNFLQNVDYETCFARGSMCSRQLRLRPAGRRDDAWPPDRPLPRDHGGRPRDAEGRREVAARRRLGCFSLYGASVGLIGFGDLARASFACPAVRLLRQAYDPWVSAHFMDGLASRRRRWTRS